MKALVSTFCECLSEGTDCSLTKQQRCEKKDPVQSVRLSLQKHRHFACTWKWILTWSSLLIFIHILLNYIMGI